MGLFDTSEFVIDAQKAKLPKHIRGIKCDVRNCAYHDGDSFCTAKTIAIGPSYAKACADTVCATFKPREMNIQ